MKSYFLRVPRERAEPSPPPGISRLRAAWRESQRRIQRLEDRQDEADRILDAVFSDAVYLHDDGLALNGQRGRKEIVKDLFGRLRFTLGIETGAHFGATAGYLAHEYGVPVYTCEVTARYFYVARHLLRELDAVYVRNLDSRVFLRELAADDAIRAECTFFYLDAHWFEDLPLAEELGVIAEGWAQWVALVDDFEVPGDPGYGFDDYGDGQALTLDYIAPVLQRHGLAAFSPATPSNAETGARRGCLITCGNALRETVGGSPLVRESNLRSA